LRELGVSFFPSPERALRALARVTNAGAQQTKPPRRHGAAPGLLPLNGVLPEYRAKQILTRFGIPVPEGALARTLEEARAIAARIGYPVALKVQSCDLPHKTDAGAVVLNIGDADALAAAWERVLGNVAKVKPGLSLDGVLVELMAQPGTELIAGARNDPEWGPVLLVGFGGVLAEALHDVRMLPPDLSIEEIIAELGRLQCSALLRGFRGSPALDVPAAAEIVVAVGELISACPAIREIDINPVVVYPEGKGAIALDALIVADANSQEAS
jgi:acyl-CoA synthetase (NDP forming)